MLNDTKSDWLPLKSGVPQGSVLGPLLFLVYINDLTHNISSNIKLFVDDSSLFTRVRSITIAHSKLIRDLETIKNWAFQWKMQFNPDISKQAIEVIFSQISGSMSKKKVRLLIKVLGCLDFFPGSSAAKFSIRSTRCLLDLN